MTDAGKPSSRLRSVRRVAGDIARKQAHVDRWCWLAVHEDGMTVSNIADETGCDEEYVSSAVERGGRAIEEAHAEELKER